jgi:hypothetical protein
VQRKLEGGWRGARQVGEGFLQCGRLGNGWGSEGRKQTSARGDWHAVVTSLSPASARIFSYCPFASAKIQLPGIKTNVFLCKQLDLLIHILLNHFPLCNGERE